MDFGLEGRTLLAKNKSSDTQTHGGNGNKRGARRQDHMYTRKITVGWWPNRTKVSSNDASEDVDGDDE